MAFTPVATVVAGTKGTATWGNSVAAAVDELQSNIQHIAFTPAGATDGSTAAGGNNWVTLGNITVPTWCTVAFVVMTAGGIHATVAAPSAWLLKVKIGGVNELDRTLAHWPAMSDRRHFTWTAQVNTPTIGVQSLIIHAERPSGSGVVTADASSRFDAQIIYSGA